MGRGSAILLALLAVVAAVSATLAFGTRSRHAESVRAAIARYGPETERDLGAPCRQAGIAWPPSRVTLLAFKSERALEVWAASNRGPFHRIATYPVLAASGTLGPKRREGDLQVPEGLYRISQLNPASRFHLSLRVDYPNADDLRNATVPRNKLGTDIYVHGSRVSAGCIAIGDAAIERVFCLVAQARPGARRILIAPVDFRERQYDAPPDQPAVRDLYRRLRAALTSYR